MMCVTKEKLWAKASLFQQTAEVVSFKGVWGGPLHELTHVLQLPKCRCENGWLCLDKLCHRSSKGVITDIFFLDDVDALSISPVWWTVFVQVVQPYVMYRFFGEGKVWGICLSVSSCLLFVLQKSQRKVFVLTLKVAFSKECVTHPFELYVTVGTVTSVHRDTRYLWCLCCIFLPHFSTSLL